MRTAGRVDGVNLHAIDAKPKDAGARVAEARHLEAGDERRAVGLVARNEADGAMAYRADNFARGVGSFDDRLQRRRRGAVEIYAGAVASAQTDRVVLARHRRVDLCVKVVLIHSDDR